MSAPGSYSADRGSSSSSSSTTSSTSAGQTAGQSDRSSTSTDTRTGDTHSANHDASSNTSTSASNKSNKNQKSIYDLQRDVTRHCAAGNKTTAFAVVTDDGSFMKLDENGNTQVKSAAGKSAKNMKVTINGSAEGDTLKVQTLSKM